MPNTTAAHVLHDFLARPDPGYALLINAPWGAGKTAFIKRETKFETDPNTLYLSLFGLNSAEAFNEALLAAFLNSPGNGTEKALRKWGERAKNVISNSRAMGFSINLSSLSVLEGLRDKLPPTLIFDDLERIEMPQSVMSGLLNRLIEHDKRRVILIANIDKISLDEKPVFDTTAEKLIGRTVKVAPDFDAALQSYWSRLPNGTGKSYLQAHQEMIKSVFTQGNHNNLRLLNYAMQASVTLLGKIDPAFFAFDEPMQRLAATHLALHMAYGGGKIDAKSLERRADFRAFGRSIIDKTTADEEVCGLKTLAENHPDLDIAAHSRPILPVQLTHELLVKGYASAKTINDSLTQTHRFKAPEDQPDWITLWNWSRLPATTVQPVLTRIEKQLAAHEITDPGEFIQIYGALDWLADVDGYSQSREQLRDTFLSYVRVLEAQGKINPRQPSTRAREKYFFGHDGGRVNYGGYAFEPDELSLAVVQSLKDAMDNAYNVVLSEKSAKLASTLRDDPEEFYNQFSNDHEKPNYYDEPILHMMDKTVFASNLFALLQSNFDLAQEIAKLIKSRRAGHSGDLEVEYIWIDEMRVEFQTFAFSIAPLHGAQAKVFLGHAL